MRTIRRTLVLVLMLAVLFSACGPAAAATKKNSNYQINDKNKATFTELLNRLKTAYETPAEDDSEQIDALVETQLTCSGRSFPSAVSASTCCSSSAV